MRNAEEIILSTPSRYYAGSSTFFTWGAVFAHEAWSKGQLPDLLATPPRATQRFFAEPHIPGDPPLAPELSLTEVETSTLGAYGLYLVTLDEEIAAAWRSDRLWMYAAGEADTAFVWKIHLADEAVAKKAEEIFADDFAGVRVARNGTKLAVTGSRQVPIDPQPDP